ncbi:MAG: hypothetical protein KGZ79_16380 [Dethiobacter sp.]|nr:hypothetical protein [Dethiobacter sp.]
MHNVTMTVKETIVRYSITNAPVPSGFDISLTDNNDQMFAGLSESQWDASGGLSGEAVFAPIPLQATSINFEIRNLPDVTSQGIVHIEGPWIIEVLL